MGPSTIAWCTVCKTVLHTEQEGLHWSFTVHMDPSNKQTKTIFSTPLTIQEYCHIAQASLELRLIDFPALPLYTWKYLHERKYSKLTEGVWRWWRVTEGGWRLWIRRSEWQRFLLTMRHMTQRGGLRSSHQGLVVYSGKSVFPSQHQSESWGITTGSQALRSGDWETFNCG